MIEIRSYRRVFELERRIYRIDRLRLNPTGVPVRGIVYFAAITAALTIVGQLPLLEALRRIVPWYLRDLAIPGVGATVLSVIRVEGRPFHIAAYSILRFLAGPGSLVGLDRHAAMDREWRPEEIVILPDGSDRRLRRLSYTGPGAVLVAVEHERTGRATERGARGLARSGWRPVLILQESSPGRSLRRARVISLGPGARMLVRPGAVGGGDR